MGWREEERHREWPPIQSLDEQHMVCGGSRFNTREQGAMLKIILCARHFQLLSILIIPKQFRWLKT